MGTTKKVALVVGIFLALMVAFGSANIWAGRKSTEPGEIKAVLANARLPGIYIRVDHMRDYYGPDMAVTHAAGDLRGFNWSDLEVGSTESTRYYNWGRLEKWLETQVAQGKHPAITLSVYNGVAAGGIAVPDYVKNDPSAVITTTLHDGRTWIVPKYWAPQFLNRYTRFIRDMGFRLRTHRPDLLSQMAFVSIGTGMYGETNAGWDPAYPEVKNALLNAGLDSHLWVETMKEITDAYIDAFSAPVDPSNPSAGKRLLVPLLQQSAPYTFSPTERRDIAAYSASKGVGLSIDGLYPEQKQAVFGGNTNVPYSGMYDQIFLYNGLVPIAWETYDYMLCNTTQVYWGILNGLDKHPDYLRLSDDLFFNFDSQGNVTGIKEDNIKIFDWASKYLGVTITNTPSVWVAMRDSRAPWQTCWQADPWQPGQQPNGELTTDTYPQWGNYSFWLKQDDSIPGGQTYPETNEERSRGGYPIEHIGINYSHPYNPNLPPGKEGWVIRRTDQASDNNYMFFRVNDGYVFKGSGPVTITVTYWDNYTDTWALAYDAAGGVQKWATPDGSDKPYVQKEGTDTYRKAVFHIPDARFGNGLVGNTDFFIYNREDGDEWIHFVDVQVDRKHREPEPTPTPTPTATPTPLPYGEVGGVVFVDNNRDFVRDSGDASVPGATVRLINGGTVMTSTVTDENGGYSISNISPGMYKLKVIFPETYKAEAFDNVDISVSAGSTIPVDFPALREFLMYLPVLRK